MFCIRAWLGMLVFLSNASPLFITLFLATNYWLQRPCVYCSILLGFLIFSLFDFHANWFEPRWQPSTEATQSVSETLSSLISGNATIGDAVLETTSLALSAINGTGGSLASLAMESVKRRAGSSTGSVSAGIGAFEALRSGLEKWQIKIPHMDITIRL